MWFSSSGQTKRPLTVLEPPPHPDGSEQADVICDDLGEAEGVVGRLLLVQLLHLVLHLGQLGEGAGQRRVVFGAAQHGHALGEAGRVGRQVWDRNAEGTEDNHLQPVGSMEPLAEGENWPFLWTTSDSTSACSLLKCWSEDSTSCSFSSNHCREKKLFPPLRFPPAICSHVNSPRLTRSSWWSFCWRRLSLCWSSWGSRRHSGPGCSQLLATADDTGTKTGSRDGTLEAWLQTKWAAFTYFLSLEELSDVGILEKRRVSHNPLQVPEKVRGGASLHPARSSCVPAVM